MTSFFDFLENVFQTLWGLHFAIDGRAIYPVRVVLICSVFALIIGIVKAVFFDGGSTD